MELLNVNRKHCMCSFSLLSPLATGLVMAPQPLLGELTIGGDGARRLDLEEEPPHLIILPLAQEVSV
jgi:hypothetical protein